MPHVMDKKIYLYGSPLNSFKSEKLKKLDVNVMYWFAPLELKEDLPVCYYWMHFIFFYEKNYRYMIISAQSSAEILQFQFIEKALLNNNIQKKHRKFFKKFSYIFI